MRSILSISDTYEGTHLDVKRAVTTIKAYEMEPFIAISEFIHEDGSTESGQIADTLDYCFGESTPDAVFIGFIRDAMNASLIASRVAAASPSIIVSDPSIISDRGEVWMTEETYNVISTAIFDMSTHIVINHLELELLACFECRTVYDFERAARKLHNCFDASIYVKDCELTGGKALFCDNTGITWIDAHRESSKPELSFGNSLNCELAMGITGIKAVTNALFFIHNGRRVSDTIPVPQSQTAPSLISPAKFLRDIAHSIDSPAPAQGASSPDQPRPAKTSIIDPVTEGTKGTVSELKPASKDSSSKSSNDSLSELAELRKRLEALKKSSM
ncbi:Phosphomethylpyrimidine kinase [Ruminococcaceae bacterium YRB3002]|nr:Phosphomethylpyrimidine kinase [Ruminococcaceae bacterium YRB3002]